MSANVQVGLFLARYQIGGDKPGAPSFHLDLAVSTPKELVSGLGHITQAVNPPIDYTYHVQGNFTYMTVMPNDTHILVVGNGTRESILPGVDNSSDSPTLTFRIVLEGDWKSGVANYQYLDEDGNVHRISDAPVKIME
ncbi:uncharacterized protein DUF1842 [Aneurinibacillus soli]|uniref:Uncharacterized protein n=1 Tax=Aneurinibacillus soli TaxID=1500254 RepID=A0A0U5BBJ7_9BACL|nr:DUF1842 domain-containing protein [Aneurinibacillus soli]PYE62943.1 uncharacterized protein DUF1842 [Aneurinibacillus soli]BAU28998.1 hypothetical protein CB4_03176 [Aneurinibacillus soli]